MANIILTDANQWDGVSSPIPLDPVSANPGGVGTIEDGLQNLTNRTAYLRVPVDVIWQLRPKIDASCTDGANLVISQASPILVWTGTAWEAHTLSAAAFAPAGLGASEWRYLYMVPGGGLEHSLTGPDLFRTFKSGDMTRRYLLPFRTLGDSTILLGYWKNGRFRSSKIDNTWTSNLLPGGMGYPVDPGPYVVNLAAWVPPTTRKAWLYVQQFNASAAATKDAFFYINGLYAGGGGGTEYENVVTIGPAPANNLARYLFEQTTDTAQKIQVSGNIQTANLDVRVGGWNEE